MPSSQRRFNDRGTDRSLSPLEIVAQDLENFSRHAGRTTVNTDDALLVARRNDALHDIIKDFIDKQKAAKAEGNARR
jgi:centromere protein S